MPTAVSLASLIFGRLDFEEDEEYLAFRFRLLIALTLGGAAATGFFVLGGYSGANPMNPVHMRVMEAYSLASLGLWALLRGHKRRFHAVAWVYLALSLADFGSALLFADSDELRVLWFFVNIPGTYLILGRRAGLAVGVGTAVGLWAVNPYLSHPYSSHALATGVVAMLYLSFLFHVHSSRAISYFKRMRALNERLKVQAAEDPLTGLMNARSYYAQCDRWLLAAQRRGAACSVLFVDLDHFKQVNDRFGHAAGDLVLKAVAARLMAGVRRSDLVGRIGGEEFSVFLPDTGLPQALALAEKLREAIASEPVVIQGASLPVTASIGVAGGPGPWPDMAQIQREADLAMYEAKAAGRNRVARLAAPAAG